MTQQITVQAIVNAPVEEVWDAYTNSKHITQWCHASDDWNSPRAENDLRIGGKFTTRMEAKDGSMGFDFGGTYDEVVTNERITYTMDGEDKRKAVVTFTSEGDGTVVSVAFDPETENPIDMQFEGWQAILDNFKKYTESLK